MPMMATHILTLREWGGRKQSNLLEGSYRRRSNQKLERSLVTDDVEGIMAEERAVAMEPRSLGVAAPLCSFECDVCWLETWESG